MKTCMFFIVTLFVFTGCTLEPPVINTEGNTFSSSKNPSIQIELPIDFEFLGNIDKDFQVSTVGYTGITLKTDRNIYLYGSVTNDNYVKKLIGISVLKLNVGKHWTPDTIRVENPLKRDIVKLGKRNFQYAIKAREATGRLAAQYLLDKGFTTPRCNMRMLFGRLFGDNVKMYISYYEDVSNFEEFGIDSCEGWFGKEMLNDKQKEYLKEFEKRAHKNIKVL